MVNYVQVQLNIQGLIWNIDMNELRHVLKHRTKYQLLDEATSHTIESQRSQRMEQGPPYHRDTEKKVIPSLLAVLELVWSCAY